jgi:hypothetical protein
MLFNFTVLGIIYIRRKQMSNEKQQTRTFELKVIVKASTMEAIDELLEMQQKVFSGQMQRELEGEGFDKVTATFIEITK